MIAIREAIVVEGKYDKIRLESVVDTVIVPTDGFGLFRDKEQLALLRRLAETRGLLVLTDSDSAGFVIRNHLIGAIPTGQIKHAYIPELAGKERRKTAPSKEGLLGVEGMDTATLEQALRRAGATVLDEETAVSTAGIDRLRLFEDGLIGADGSADRRRRLLAMWGLPGKLSTARMLEVINATMDLEMYEKSVKMLDHPKKPLDSECQE